MTLNRPKARFTGPDLCALPARDVVALLKRGKVSSAELVEASLTRIKTTTPAINAMVTTAPERARARAASADPTAPLAGLPLGIKDLSAVAGVRSTSGTPAFADHIPDSSDPLVERLERNGGIVIGKTNTPEMGAGANTFNAVFGHTRNPWNTALNPGGSSGGAAAGLATGETWLSHGSDLGGSLRTPASFCGIVGLRPTPGRVANPGGADLFAPFSVEGPMARDTRDLALFLDAMAGTDPRCPISHPSDPGAFQAACATAPGPIRLTFSPDLGGLAPVERDIAETLQRALTALQAPGLAIEESTPQIPGLERCFRTHRALGMWTGFKATPPSVTEQFKPALLQNIHQGGTLTVDDIADATLTRSRLFATMQGLLTQYDVLACPVTGIGPLKAEIEYPTEVAGQPCKDYLDWLRFTFLASVCGLPALSLPVGFTPTGLPVGLQLIGPPRGEARLLQIACRLEDALNLPKNPIDPLPPTP